MNKAVIYVRVSSKDQEIEGFSIPAQHKSLHEYAAKKHLTIVKEFGGAETAKKAGRAEFSKMVQFLRDNREVKHLLVEKTDRLSRNLTDFFGIIFEELVKGGGLNVHFVKEGRILNKNSHSSERLASSIHAVLAQNKNDNLAEEVIKGMEEKAEQGIYPSWAPYGYTNTEECRRRVIKVNPQQAVFVKRMFDLYATGSYSLSTLRKKLLAEGMVYRGGKPFYKSKVETILKNEFYAGTFRWRGVRYEGATHEPIISKELFACVQKVLRSPYKSKSRKEMFAYSNMIICGVCGCSLTAEFKKGKYIYYRCTRARGNCSEPYIRQEDIDQRFEGILGSIHVPDEIQAHILQGLRDSIKNKVDYHNHLAQSIEQQIKVLKNRIDQAYSDKLDGKISEDSGSPIQSDGSPRKKRSWSNWQPHRHQIPTAWRMRL